MCWPCADATAGDVMVRVKVSGWAGWAGWDGWDATMWAATMMGWANGGD